MKRTIVLAVALALCASGWSIVVYAVCNQTSASDADMQLWAFHGCWQEYFLWQYRAYDVHSPHWDDRGFFDACNPNLEYPKHWNSTYLIDYGLADNPSQSWHGTIDYDRLSNAAHNEFKFELFHTVADKKDDNDDTNASWIHHAGSPNEIRGYCLLYDESGYFTDNPASRAGTFMHEGWHGWQQEYRYQGGHIANPEGGQCTAAGKNCDYFYFHGVGEYDFGKMYENDGTAKRFHSPNQAKLEFLCDVVDQSQAWVPASVRDAASAEADAIAVQKFINGPGYKCGDSRPW